MCLRTPPLFADDITFEAGFGDPALQFRAIPGAGATPPRSCAAHNRPRASGGNSERANASSSLSENSRPDRFISVNS